jgi:hypothetical protein
MGVDLSVNDGDRTIRWHERCLIIQSIDASNTAQIRVQARLGKAEKASGERLVRTQGTPRRTGRAQVEEQLSSILSSVRVKSVFQVSIQEEGAEQPVRASRGKLSSPRQIWSFQIQVQRTREAIERARTLLGWRVFAANQPTAALGLDAAVEASRDDSLLERTVGRRTGHPLSLGPLAVQGDDHRVGRRRLLTIALRVVTILEGVVRSALAASRQAIAHTGRLSLPRNECWKPSTRSGFPSSLVPAVGSGIFLLYLPFRSRVSLSVAFLLLSLLVSPTILDFGLSWKRTVSY